MSNTTKKDALKAILTAFGQTTNAKTEKALLFQIAESFQTAVEEGSIVINVLELPTVTSDDNGKVLGVSNGEWAVIDAPVELPSVSSTDNGKVLGVVEGEWAVVDTTPEETTDSES
jgi:hypothetical protein